jgi:hypothetical protein
MRVAVMEIVAVVGGDERDAGFLGEADEVFVYALLDFKALVLNFEEEIAFAENVAEAISILAGQVEFFIHHRFGDRAAKAGGEGDEAFAVLGEKIEINAWLVIEAFEESGGDELDEIVVTLEIFAEKNEVVTAAGAGFHFAAIAVGGGCGFFAAVVAAAFGDVDFAADDGLDVALAGFIEKVGGGEKIAVVRDGHRGHLLARGFVEEFAGFARAVEKAEIGVDVEMNKLRIAHGS